MSFLSSIKGRLVLTFILLSVVVLPLMGMISNWISSGIIIDILTRMNSQTVSDTCENLNIVFENTRNIAENLAYNEGIRHILSEDYVNKSGAQKIGVNEEVGDTVSEISSINPAIAVVQIIGRNGFNYNRVFAQQANLVDNYEEITRSRFYEEHLKSRKDYMFFLSSEFPGDKLFEKISGNHGNSILISYLVKAEREEILGEIIIVINSEYIRSTVLKEDLEGSDYHIVNDRSSWSGKEILDDTDIQVLKQLSLHHRNGSGKVELSGDEAIVAYNSVKNPNWKFFKTTRISSVTKDLEDVGKLTAAIVILFTLVAVAASLLLSGILSRTVGEFTQLFKWNGELDELKQYDYPRGKWMGFLGGMQFKNRIAVLFLCIVLIPAIALTTASIMITSRIIKKVDVSLWQNAAAQAVKRVDFDLQLKRSLIQEVFRNEHLQIIMRNIKAGESSDKYANQISKVLYNANFSKYGIQYITIYDSQNRIVYSTLSKSKSSYIDYTHQLMPADILKTYGGKVRWLGTYADTYNNFVFAATRELRDFSSVTSGDFDNLGYVLVAFDESILEGYYRNLSGFPGAEVFLTDKDGRIISSNDKSQIFSNVKNMGYKLGSGEEAGYVERSPQGEMLVLYDTSEMSSWKIVGKIPMEEAIKSAGLILQYNLLVLVLSALLLTAFAYGISRKVSKPLEDLMGHIARLENGDLDVSFHYRGKDEFFELAKSFNNMVARLKELIKEVYEEKISRQETAIRWKEAELNALQAQINPHFLYNTLDAIRCKAMFLTDGENEVSDMILNLSELFRLSIRKGRELVSIADEIEHVKCYLAIEDFRFGDKIRLEWNIDEGLLQYKTVKLILQPIVENAIYHGLEPKKGIGTISVRVCKAEDRIVFSISDDGAGMTDTELEQVSENIAEGTGRSIGLVNVNQRIRLHFGNQYGIEIRSRHREGTEVKVTIPAIL